MDASVILWVARARLTDPPSSIATGRCSDAFRSSAGDELLAALDADSGVVFAVDDDLVLQFVNLRWESFARENGGEHCIEDYRVGSSIRAVIPEVLRRFYRAGFAAAPIGGPAWEHLYECSSPDTFRGFRMRAARLEDGHYLVVSNDLVRASAAGVDAALVAADYVDEHHIVVQCAHCRRVRRVATTIWDWVPAYVTTPYARVSHSLCESCFAYHYPE